MSPAAPPLFDPAAALPELAQIGGAARAGDWPAIEAYFAGLADEQARSAAAGVVADTAGIERLLQWVVQQQPANLLAAVLLADRHTVLAWEARTSARAKYVTAEQWAVFRTHLNQAEQLLIRATAHDPGLAMAWSLRITVAMGLSLGQSEARRRYRNLSRVAPHHLPGQRSLLQQLVPKWGGSWESAGEFARESFRGAPAGSLAGLLVAEYHLERWLDLGREAGAEYLRRPEVRQELARAAAGSVLHPDCRARYSLISAHSTFAVLASLAGDLTAAAVHFRAMGPYGSTAGWDYLGGDPEAAFIEHRDRALAKG